YFGGAALGSFIAVYAWKHWGWEACAALGLAMAMLSFVIDRLDFYEMNKIAKQEKAP
ncbi:MFS transporter, partial [Acinetobacter baumannii]